MDLFRSSLSVLRLLIIPLIALSIVAACTPRLDNRATKGAQTYQRAMDYYSGAYQRSYRLHIPAHYSPSEAMPLVVVIHGAFDTAEGIEKVSGFSELADREKFLVLYPNGIGIMGWLQHWNAGHCCGKAAADGIDDVGFIAAAMALMGWLVPHDMWRTLAIWSSVISLIAIILFWNAFVTLFPNKIGAIAVDVATLVALLWANWPSEAAIAY